MREQPTLLLIDNRESVLLPSCLGAPELLSEEAALLRWSSRRSWR